MAEGRRIEGGREKTDSEFGDHEMFQPTTLHAGFPTDPHARSKCGGKAREITSRSLRDLLRVTPRGRGIRE